MFFFCLYLQIKNKKLKSEIEDLKLEKKQVFNRNKEIKEEQDLARKRIMHMLIDSINHRRFNNLHRTNCVKLEEKYVTTMLKPNIVEVPI